MEDIERKASAGTVQYVVEPRTDDSKQPEVVSWSITLSIPLSVSR